MEVTPQFVALAAALAKAQGAFTAIPKNRSVTIKGESKSGSPVSYNFKYADLEAILAATRPALSTNGLSLVQVIDDEAVTTLLIHAEGGTIQSKLSLPTLRDVGSDPKKLAATISYFRRYAVSGLLCVAADDDLDQSGREPGDDKAADGEPASPDLLAAAREESAKGSKSYAAFWAGLASKERDAIGKENFQLKREAQAADKRISAKVEAPAKAEEGVPA